MATSEEKKPDCDPSRTCATRGETVANSGQVNTREAHTDCDVASDLATLEETADEGDRACDTQLERMDEKGKLEGNRDETRRNVISRHPETVRSHHYKATLTYLKQRLSIHVRSLPTARHHLIKAGVWGTVTCSCNKRERDCQWRSCHTSCDSGEKCRDDVLVWQLAGLIVV